MTDPKQPPRRSLPPEVVKAAKVISQEVWNEPYREGEGVMTHAGGPFWRSELLGQADEWERMAKAARVCAEVLPDA